MHLSTLLVLLKNNSWTVAWYEHGPEHIESLVTCMDWMLLLSYRQHYSLKCAIRGVFWECKHSSCAVSVAHVSWGKHISLPLTSLSLSIMSVSCSLCVSLTLISVSLKHAHTHAHTQHIVNTLSSHAVHMGIAFPLGNLSFLYLLKPRSYKDPRVRVALWNEASRNAPASWPCRLFHQQETDSKIHTTFHCSCQDLNVEKRNTIRVRPWCTLIALLFGSPLDFRKPDGTQCLGQGPQKQMNRMPVRSCFSCGCVSREHFGCRVQNSSPK